MQLYVNGTIEPIPLDYQGSHFDNLVSAHASLTARSRNCIAMAVELADITQHATEMMRNLTDKLDNPGPNMVVWSLGQQHLSKLRDPGSNDMDPEVIFSREGTTRPRVVLRLLDKDILQRIKKLPYQIMLKLIRLFELIPVHRQVLNWMDNWDASWRKLLANRYQGKKSIY